MACLVEGILLRCERGLVCVRGRSAWLGLAELPCERGLVCVCVCGSLSPPMVLELYRGDLAPASGCHSLVFVSALSGMGWGPENETLGGRH